MSVVTRFGALFRKELAQVKGDRRLAMSLVVPPVLQVLLFGFALDSQVKNLDMGVVDQSRTKESRELVTAFTNNEAFRLDAYYASTEQLQEKLTRGELDAGLVIDTDFAKLRNSGRPANIQLLLNAVNANTATIAEAYSEGILADYLGREFPGRAPPVTSKVAILYNPGLHTSWFIVPGVFGVLLILNGSLVAASAMIKEKETGTVEQLLMTPAGALEIVLAKIAPLFLLLMMMTLLVLTVVTGVFQIPIRGSFFLLYGAAALCVLTGIGIGTLLATFSSSAQQTQLLAFFVNPPLATLSGALTPIEAMPKWLQPLTLLNPIRHFAEIARGVFLKASGVAELYPNLLALGFFAAVAFGLSMWRFRKQLG